MSFPESAALRVIGELGINGIEDLYLTNEIAWERGAVVFEEKLSGAEARILISRPQSVITISTAISDLNRRRFGVSHELGHLEMHRRQQQAFNCTKGDLDSGGIKERISPTLENEANEFAAALLMPEIFFAQHCKETIELSSIQQLANMFRVSLTAAAIRFVNFSLEPLAIVFSYQGCVKWFEMSNDFSKLGLFIRVGERLDRRTLAASAFQNVALPVKITQVPVSAWMRPGQYHPNATIAEQSLAMPNYNSVLSLLWVNETIDGDEDWFND